MALYCLISPGGSPGVTTTALALALSWPVEVVLAEVDPAGRRVLPGFLAERLDGPPGPGLLGLAMAIGRDPQPATARVENYTIPLTDHGQAWLLHGLRDPRHAQQLTPLWQPLTETLTSTGSDVIADLGRIGGSDTPVSLLTGADLVVMVLHRTLPQVDAAQPRLYALLDMLTDQVPVMLCLIGDGPYPAAAVQKALFGLPILPALPHAPPDARVLSDGAAPRLTFRTSLLMRAAANLGHQMRKTVDEHAFHPDSPTGLPVTPGGAR